VSYYTRDNLNAAMGSWRKTSGVNIYLVDNSSEILDNSTAILCTSCSERKQNLLVYRSAYICIYFNTAGDGGCSFLLDGTECTFTSGESVSLIKLNDNTRDCFKKMEKKLNKLTLVGLLVFSGVFVGCELL
jgi:hypothetical protein